MVVLAATEATLAVVALKVAAVAVSSAAVVARFGKCNGDCWTAL